MQLLIVFVITQGCRLPKDYNTVSRETVLPS